MKRTILLFAISVLLIEAKAQLTIQPGARFTTTGNVVLVLDNTSVTNNDTQSDLSHSTLLVSGAGPATLKGGGNWHLGSLVLKKPGGSLALETSLDILDSIRMSGGLLDLNGNNIVLQPAAVLKGETASSRIMGSNGGEISITVPIAGPAPVDPGGLGFLITAAGNLGQVTVKRGHLQQFNSSITRYFEVTSAGGGVINGRFTYLEPELGNVSESTLQFMQRSVGGSVWQPGGFTLRDPSANFLQKGGLPLQHRFTLAPFSDPLPVKWGPFTVQCLNGFLKLRWETRMEENTSHFFVQRSTGGNTWSTITRLAAAGSVSGGATYTYTDSAAAGGQSYFYRIQSVDFDGKVSYSGILPVQACGSLAEMKIVPVPVVTNASLQVQSAVSYKTFIQLIGADGRIHQQSAADIRTGLNVIPLQTVLLPAGSYFVRVRLADGSLKTLPFLK